MSDTVNMYEFDDEDTLETSSSSQTPAVKMQINGMLKELDIAGQKFKVIDPSVVQDLQTTVRSLQSYIIKLENSLRNMNLKFSNMERKIKSMEAELDNKVNYD
jgi:tRNA C32,U32 (ribose-2'-O)-methylase TrmJ